MDNLDPPQKLDGKSIKNLTCGCCSNGCCCENHRDVPMGRLRGPCAYHAALPHAPLCDRVHRYDASVGDFVRVPLPEGPVR